MTDLQVIATRMDIAMHTYRVQFNHDIMDATFVQPGGGEVFVRRTHLCLRRLSPCCRGLMAFDGDSERWVCSPCQRWVLGWTHADGAVECRLDPQTGQVTFSDEWWEHGVDAARDALAAAIEARTFRDLFAEWVGQVVADSPFTPSSF